MKIEVIFLIFVLILVIFLNFYFDYNDLAKNTSNIIINGNKINLDSLTLRQKISQMIIVRGDFYKNLKSTNPIWLSTALSLTANVSSVYDVESANTNLTTKNTK